MTKMVKGEDYFSAVGDPGGTLLVGAVPLPFAGHVEHLHRLGVRGVINMQYEYRGPKAEYEAMKPCIEQLYLPCVDHEEPSVEQLRSAVSFIRRYADSGDRVLVHCKGGHGRSAAVALAWLLTKQGGFHTPESGQERLNSVRSVRKKLYAQKNIRDFYSFVKSGKV